MTLYRVYVETNGPRDWVEYIEAETPEAAIAEADDDPEAPNYLVALPLPEEMEHKCVCSEQPVLFKRIEATPSYWRCQNCQRDYVCPPDEIVWDDEKMFDQGYEPCMRHEGYKHDCRWCHGSGWWRPGPDEDEGDDDDDWPPDDDDDELILLGPYYETDETLYLED